MYSCRSVHLRSGAYRFLISRRERKRSGLISLLAMTVIARNGVLLALPRYSSRFCRNDPLQPHDVVLAHGGGTTLPPSCRRPDTRAQTPPPSLLNPTPDRYI